MEKIMSSIASAASAATVSTSASTVPSLLPHQVPLSKKAPLEPTSEKQKENTKKVLEAVDENTTFDVFMNTIAEVNASCDPKDHYQVAMGNPEPGKCKKNILHLAAALDNVSLLTKAVVNLDQYPLVEVGNEVEDTPLICAIHHTSVNAVNALLFDLKVNPNTSASGTREEPWLVTPVMATALGISRSQCHMKWFQRNDPNDSRLETNRLAVENGRAIMQSLIAAGGGWCDYSVDSNNLIGYQNYVGAYGQNKHFYLDERTGMIERHRRLPEMIIQVTGGMLHIRDLCQLITDYDIRPITPLATLPASASAASTSSAASISEENS
jgi:hypothetical protein